MVGVRLLRIWVSLPGSLNSLLSGCVFSVPFRVGFIPLLV